MNQDTTAEAAAHCRHQAAAPCHTCSSMAAAGMSARATMLKPRPPSRCRISSAPANTRPVTLMAAGEAVGKTASESPMLAAGYGICCWWPVVFSAAAVDKAHVRLSALSSCQSLTAIRIWISCSAHLQCMK